jgi:hypothetical protein
MLNKSIIAILTVMTLTIGLLLLPPGVHGQNTASKPATQKQDDGIVILPQSPKNTYTLRELANTLSQSLKREVYVDTRSEDRRLLIVCPNGSRSIPAVSLKEVMSRVTGMQWRRVEEIDFLTFHAPDSLRQAAQKKQAEMLARQKGLVRSLEENFPDAMSVSGDAYFGSPKNWDQLSEGERNNLRQMLEQSTGSSANQLKNILKDPSALSGARISFMLDVQITERARGGSVIGGGRLVNE